MNSSRKAYVQFSLTDYNFDIMILTLIKLQMTVYKVKYEVEYNRLVFFGTSPKFNELSDYDEPMRYTLDKFCNE